MNLDLTGLLRQGLLHLRQGGSAQSYLDQLELSGLQLAQLNDLRSLLETAATAARLDEIPVPAPRAVSINRTRFLSSAAALREGAAAGRPPASWTLWPRVVRLVLSLALVLGLLLGAGSGVVNVAAASLPGSALYPVKLAVEDARLLLTLGDLRRAELYLRYANERTEEMLQLCAAGQPVDQAVVDRFALQLEGAVSAAASVAHGSEPGSAMGILKEVIKSASEQHHSLSEASVVAPDTVQPALNAGAAAAQQSGEVAQQELAQLIAVLPTPTRLAQLPATATATLRAAEPTATSAPPPIVQPTQPPQPPPDPTATEAALAGPSVTPAPTRTVPRSVSPTPEALVSITVVSPRPSRTDVNSTRTPMSAATLVTPAVTAPPSDVSATATPPVARFRVELKDSADPVPASFRIHYTACVVNEGAAALTNAIVRIGWTPAQCAYVPPDNPVELVFSIGSVGAGSRSCVSFALNTSVICAGTQITAEAVVTCDQGSTSEKQVTTLASPPTPTATITRTPVVQFSLTVSDRPDPVTAGNALHLELCVNNHGDQPLSNVVLEDIWSPRDCVYLPPDNPFSIRWSWPGLAAHSVRCVSLTLSSYSTCEGSLVANRATMTCDQGTTSAEQLTKISRVPTWTPTPTATATSIDSPPATPTGSALAVETLIPSPTLTEQLTENDSPPLASR